MQRMYTLQKAREQAREDYYKRLLQRQEQENTHLSTEADVLNEHCSTKTLNESSYTEDIWKVFRWLIQDTIREHKDVPMEKAKAIAQKHYGEMLGIAQEVTAKPSEKDIRRAADIISEELNLGESVLQEQLTFRSLGEGEFFVLVKTSIVAAWNAYMKFMTGEGLKIAAVPVVSQIPKWLGAVVVTTSGSYFVFSQTVAVVIALCLGVASYYGFKILGSIVKEFGRWAFHKIKIRENTPAEAVSFLSSLGSSTDQEKMTIYNLKPRHFYHFAIDATVYAATLWKRYYKLQPGNPFVFVGFGAPRFTKGVYMIVEPQGGEFQNEMVFAPLEYVKHIRDIGTNQSIA